MTRTITLVGADGTTWDLCAGPVVFAGGDVQVWGLPQVQVSARSSAALPGARVTARRHLPRDLVIPIKVIGATPDDVEVGIAAFGRALDPARGDVTLIVGRPDATARKLTATYMGGFELMQMRWIETELAAGQAVLRAHDPYWTDVVDQTVEIVPPPPVFTSGVTPFSEATWAFNEPQPFNGYVQGTSFNEPIAWNAPFPFSGGAGGVVVFTITNTGGDVDVWPWFDVQGPCTVLEVYNLTTARSWSVPGGLTGGQHLIVDTRPTSRQVTINAGNAWAQLDGSLWSLRSSTTQMIAIRFDGTVDGTSEMTMRWLPQWLTS